MGTGQLNTAVADAGPLIHLSEIGCLSVMCIFDILHVPEAVWSETVIQGRVPEADLMGLSVVRRHTLSQSEVTRFTRKGSFQELQDGERECLYLCKQLSVSTLLTDDIAVREASKRLNFTPVGSLGIVAKAYRSGQISLDNAEHYIADLYDVSSLFVTRAIVELAIEQIHSHSD